MIQNITAGLVCSIIVFCFTNWKSEIADFLGDFFYKGVKVKGTWKVTEEQLTAKGYELTFPSNYTFELMQRSDAISGTAQAEFFNSDNQRDLFHYKVSGKIKDRFVSLTLEIQEKNKISHLNFLLEVIGDGDRMKGYKSFYAKLGKEINSIETVWTQIKC